MTGKTDVMIIGAGPAGIAAAIYLQRAGVDYVVFEKDEPGGLLRNAWLVENYPGFPGGESGPGLTRRMVAHAAQLGVGITREKVVSLSREEGMFRAKTDSGIYEAAIAVIASGTTAVNPDGIRVSEEASACVFHQVTEAVGIEGKKFAVIGGGDVAFDYALSLAEKNKVAIFVRGSKPRCLDLLLDRCGNHENISVYLEAEIFEICKSSGGVVLVGEGGEAGMSIEADYVMLATGRRPCLDYVEKDLFTRFDLLSASGKLYLVGDVLAGSYRQASIAIGRAVEAAMRITDYLEGRRR
ncbi:MAG TPA: NAD(P)/FAD-dependent oxidoreductase [Candidatus Krumholzibacterium sp.]|nr:NAD(P)/FAD-dependent oxidoreductase [Candidatus Krumholzibacterium sp.]